MTHTTHCNYGFITNNDTPVYTFQNKCKSPVIHKPCSSNQQQSLNVLIIYFLQLDEGIPGHPKKHWHRLPFYSLFCCASPSIIHALLSRINPAQTAHLTCYALIHITAYTSNRSRHREAALPSGKHTNLNSSFEHSVTVLCTALHCNLVSDRKVR